MRAPIDGYSMAHPNRHLRLTVLRRRVGRLRLGFTHLWIHACGAAVALVTLGLCASAAHGQQLIRACYSPSHDRGELRVLNAHKCSSSEKELQWNKAGRRGHVGPQGARGLQGERGEPGADDSEHPRGRDDEDESSQSFSEEALEFVGLGMGALLSALLSLLVLVLLILQALTRAPFIKDTRLVRLLRPTSFVVEPLDDSAIGQPSIGPAITGLLRNRVSAYGDRYDGDYVTGQKVVRRTLKSFKDFSASFQNLSGSAGTALAIVDFLARTLPRRRFVLRGELQPAGVAGPGVSLALQDNAAEDSLTVLWATPLEVRATGAAGYQRLAIPAGAWTDHRLTSALAKTKQAQKQLLSQNAESWAFFRAGLECHRLGEDTEARSLYEQSLGRDGDNLGAAANLGLLERRERQFRRAAELLASARKELAKRDPTFSRNPDWYRIRYQLAALYLNSASVKDGTPRLSNDTTLALRESEAVAAESVTLIVQPAALPALWHRVRGLQRKKTLRNEREELLAFLETTIAPSALMLLAGAMHTVGAPVSPTVRPSPALVTYKDVLDVLGSSEVDPEALVKFVEAQPNLAPRVYYNLSCYQVLRNRHQDAKEWLDRAFLHTTTTERYALLRIVEKDTTLDPLTEDLAYLERLREYVPRQK
jgi:tetratricopeptide (TPR) repeat protein